jgi:hypothetical protein
MPGNYQAGKRAEEHIADQLPGGVRTPNEWYDVESVTGVHEVKSTVEELSSGRNGRFRLWKHQHERLEEEGGTYHFLVDGVGIEEIPAEEVTELIEQGNLSWTGSGNHGMDQRQVKIRWPEIFNR